MASRETAFVEITPEVLLKAYACGIFPMAESAEDPALYWIEPEKRGIIPLDTFHVPSRLARTVRSDRFSIAINRDFDGVLDGCAEPQPGRARTWINARIRTLYQKLYNIGHCHSVEAYENGVLAGGLYGVCLGRAFFGESMFHRSRDASKVALVHLVARLRAGGFTLLDTQFVTDHLKTFGAVEVSRRQYHKLLEASLVGEADFAALSRKHDRRGSAAIRAGARRPRLDAARRCHQNVTAEQCSRTRAGGRWRRRQRCCGGSAGWLRRRRAAAWRAAAARGCGARGCCGGRCGGAAPRRRPVAARPYNRSATRRRSDARRR